MEPRGTGNLDESEGNPVTAAQVTHPLHWTSNSALAEESRTLSCLEEMLGEFATPATLNPVASTLPPTEKFDKALLDSAGDVPSGVFVDAKYYDERDFQSHRTEDFPQTHHPLRPILARTSKKKLSSVPSVPLLEGSPTIEDAQLQNVNDETSTAPIKIPHQASYSQSITISSPPSADFQDLMESSLKKVQFEVGGSPFTVDEYQSGVEKKRYRVPVVEDPQLRMRPGHVRDAAEIPLLRSGHDMGDLSEVDKDELSSHRFDNAKGFRRHKFGTKGQLPDEDVETPRQNKFDHQPHEIFVELDILTGRDGKREWQEAARWIKYEEDLEEGADRWGKPHVASLSFHSLINLRRLLETGVVLLDLEERDLPGVAYRVVEQMGTNELILMEEKALVLRSLLLKHRHVNESAKVWNLALKRSPESHTSLQTVFDDRSHRKGLTTVQSVDPGMFQHKTQTGKPTGIKHQNSVPAQMHAKGIGGRDFGSRRRNSAGSTHSHLELDLNKITPGLSEEDLKWIEKESTLMRQIPSNSEATIVLVGNDDALQGVTIAFVRLAESVYMPNITEVPIPVRFLFILMGPSTADLDYKEIGRSISTLMSNQQFHSMAYQAEERRDLLKGINDFLDACIVLPHGDWDDDLIPLHDLREKNKATQRRKLQESARKDLASVSQLPTKLPARERGRPGFTRTRRLFGGLIDEVRKRYPLYVSDIRHGLNFQCLATVIFLYFACISGAVAFGDLLKVKTDEYIGITESLIGAFVGGILFSLFSAQPLLIVGATGPTLVFDESLFNFCKSSGLEGNEILAVRSWIGFWLFVIGLIVACFEGSVLVRYFTRFTQEVMAVFISFVFIYESFSSLIKIYNKNPLQDTYNSTTTTDGSVTEGPRPNVALLSTILMLGTFYVAYFFRQFKTGVYLNKAMRKMLGNFGVMISIVVMCLFDGMILHPETDKLSIPDISDGLKTTNPTKRGWLIQPLDLPLSWIYASIIPAFLLYILLFIETSIAELIVGKREYKLRKGCGFHLDVLVLCLINTVMGFWGLPWISSAIVRAVSHVVALTVYSTNNPPGEKPMLIGVKEQRVTSFAVSVLLGCSILMGPLLRHIPMAVLFGVFLYMGISSMAGIQFLQRIKLIFKQTENYPEVAFVKRVRTLKMHLFTLLQAVLLGIVWAVKASPGALALPFVIILLIPFRYFVLPRFFSKSELKALDAQGGEDDEEKKNEDVSQETLTAGGSIKKAGNGHTITGLTNGLKMSSEADLEVNSGNNGQLSFRSI